MLMEYNGNNLIAIFDKKWVYLLSFFFLSMSVHSFLMVNFSLASLIYKTAKSKYQCKFNCKKNNKLNLKVTSSIIRIKDKGIVKFIQKPNHRLETVC